VSGTARLAGLRGPAIGTLLVLLWAGPAGAQVWIGGGGATPRGGSIEISGGVLWSQGFDLGSAAAALTRNPTTGSSPFPLFNSDTQLDPAPGALARVGVYLSRRVSLEGGIQYSRPRLSTRLSGDAEGADAVTVSETLTRYVFDGALVVHLPAFAGGHGVPFLTGGAGYIRELHEGNELVDTGTQYHAGAGVKFWFGEMRRRFGIRADVGVDVRDGGFDFKEGRRTVPTAGASLLYLF
jgi:hypothetical protein